MNNDIKRTRNSKRVKILKEITVKMTLKTSSKHASVLMSRHKALKLILTATAVEIRILESLILAQDERWRRA